MAKPPPKINRLPEAIISAAKIFFFEGQSICDIAKKLGVSANSLYKQADRHEWERERLEIAQGKPLTKADLAKPEIAVTRNLAEDKRQYLESVSQQILEKGLNPLKRHDVQEIGDVQKHFLAMNSIHSVAKDVFGIGKETPTPNLVVNMGFLSKEADDEPQKPAIDVQVDPVLPSDSDA